MLQKKRYLIPILATLFLLYGFSDEYGQLPTKQIAFVIDDFGNNMQGTKEMLDMPIPLTIAVMPFLPTSKRDAEWAYQRHHDVFVHIPMEPVSGKKSWLGPPGKKTATILRQYIPQLKKEANIVLASKLVYP